MVPSQPANSSTGSCSPEYLDPVALLAVDAGYIDKGYIHTDVSHDGSAFAIDNDAAPAVSEMPVVAVGIPDGYGSDARGTGKHSATTVPHRLTGLQIADLKNGRFQRTDGAQTAVGSP